MRGSKYKCDHGCGNVTIYDVPQMSRKINLPCWKFRGWIFVIKIYKCEICFSIISGNMELTQVESIPYGLRGVTYSVHLILQTATCLMDLLPDTLNCGLCICWECRERFPRHRCQRTPLVSDPGMHHGTCVRHVPWCMSGLLTRGAGKTYQAFPAHAQLAILRIWQEAYSTDLDLPE